MFLQSTLNTVEPITTVVGGLFFSLLVPLFFLNRALKSVLQSTKSANFGLFFGSMFLFNICLNLISKENLYLIYISGSLLLIFSFLGVFCSIKSFCFFRKDKTTILRPLFALLLSAVHLFIAICYFSLVYKTSFSNPEPWVYENKEHSFSITLPSKNWVKIEETEKITRFTCQYPPMNILISYQNGVILNGFEQLKKEIIQNVVPKARDPQAEIKEGNLGFNPYISLKLKEKSYEEIEVAMFCILNVSRNKLVQIAIEGQPMKSELGKTRLAQVFGPIVQEIFQSIKLE